MIMCYEGTETLTYKQKIKATFTSSLFVIENINYSSSSQQSQSHSQSNSRTSPHAGHSA